MNYQLLLQGLAHLLYEAASKGGYVDPAKVEKILGVSQQEDCGYVNPAKEEQIVGVSQQDVDLSTSSKS